MILHGTFNAISSDHPFMESHNRFTTEPGDNIKPLLSRNDGDIFFFNLIIFIFNCWFSLRVTFSIMQQRCRLTQFLTFDNSKTSLGVELQFERNDDLKLI